MVDSGEQVLYGTVDLADVGVQVVLEDTHIQFEFRIERFEVEGFHLEGSLNYNNN